MIPGGGDLEHELAPLLARAGGAPDGWPTRIGAYLDLLREWNGRVNLVSRHSLARLVPDQLVPSLAALLVVPPGARIRVLDVGSGGGFPGVPLGILRPDARIDLVDATRKKCEFLEAAVAAVGLRDARVHWCRIESPGDSLRARAAFDVAIARAVGNTEIVVPAARRLLRDGGRLWRFVPPGTPGSRPWPPEGAAVTALRAD